MKYILNLRPYSIGTCPTNGLVKATLPTCKEERHGVLEYDRLLTIEEITHFDLIPMWESMEQFINYLLAANFFNESRIKFIAGMVEYAGHEGNEMSDIYDGIGADIRPNNSWIPRGQFSEREIGQWIFENEKILFGLA